MVGKKSNSNYKRIMTEAVVSVGKVYSNPFANSFKSPDQIKEDLDTPAKYSSNEAKLHLDADIKKMSKFLGKASQECIKINNKLI